MISLIIATAATISSGTSCADALGTYHGPRSSRPHTNLRLRNGRDRDEKGVDRGRMLLTSINASASFNVRLYRDDLEKGGFGLADDASWCWECDSGSGCIEGVRLKLEWCFKDERKQRFQYVANASLNAGQIKVKGTDLCVSANKRSYALQLCDASDTAQNFLGFNDAKQSFKLNPLDSPDQCVSTEARQQFSGDKITIEPCKAESKSKASSWTLYEVSDEPELMGVQCTKSFPCDECEGHCSKDDHCRGELACFQREGYQSVPGCMGSGRKDQGYCYRPQGGNGIMSESDESNQNGEVVASLDGLVLSYSKECNSIDQCGKCQGDCDHDHDCESGLKCFERNGDEEVPGCFGEGKYGKDYCYQPPSDDDASESDSSFQLVLNKSCEKGICGECEGDCSDDKDCLDGLVCFRLDGKTNVPGCLGTGLSGRGYCIEERNIELSQTTSDAKSKESRSCKGNGVDKSSYNFEDNVPASYSSPLNIKNTPQFVALSFDDNGKSGLDGVFGGMEWLTNMLADKHHQTDGAPVRVSFYHTSMYIEEWKAESPVLVKRAWRDALDRGHEIGLHSNEHPHGSEFSKSMWSEEIEQCFSWLTKPYDPNEDSSSPRDESGVGASAVQINGWRAPFLEYNDNMMKALMKHGIWYDTSIEEGWESEQDGTSFFWPYTLDSGREGRYEKPSIGNHRGLWEMPVYPLIVPPDDVAEQYGIRKGLRDKCKSIVSWFDVESGKVTGFDYNLWVQFQMTPPEFLATLKYSLDLRLEGNRAPFMPGFHSDYYSDKYTQPNAWAQPFERRQALLDFVDYALGKPEARLVPVKDVLNWLRDPIPLDCL